jgi:hypothetical protein
MRLAVRGEKTDEIGVYFTAADGTEVRVPADRLSPNTIGKLQFVLSASVTPGKWRVKVATQSTFTRIFTKEVRVYEYPDIVTVL